MSKTVVIGVIAVVLLASALGGLFLWSDVRNQVSHTPASEQPTPPPAPILPLQVEIFDASNWQTYRNDEFGFELKYPEDGIFTTEGERVKIDFATGFLSIGTPGIESDECVIYNSYLSPTPDQFSELVTINGVEFLKYNVAELMSGNTVADHGRFITLQSDYCIDIAFMTTYPSPAEYEEEKKIRGRIFDQILSTFRFEE